MTEADYKHAFAVVDGEVDMAISCFYTEIVLNQLARDDEDVCHMLNKHAAFWKVHRYCLQSTFFITLSRVFDVSGDVHSIHTLLSMVIKHPERFSKDVLRVRKSQSPAARRIG